MGGDALPAPAPGPLTVRCGGRDEWAVYDRLSVRVSARFARKELAEAARAALRQAAGNRPRPCLCCGAEFASEGAHNRLCGRCRHIDGGLIPASWARRGRRGEGARA